MRLDYNSPVVLTFTLLCLAVQVIDSTVSTKVTDSFFTVYSTFDFKSVLDYVRLFTHSIGHSGFQHLLSNSFILLLLGPILEEKYGTKNMILVIASTAFVTAVINILFFTNGVRGASGVVFAFIVLASIVNLKKGTIPITFLLVFLIHVGGEVVNSFKDDSISQMAHIIGGLVGAVFGFLLTQSTPAVIEAPADTTVEEE